MIMKTNKMLKAGVVGVVLLALAGSQAMADGYRGRGYDGPRYHHTSGGWQRAGWFGFGAVVGALTIGAIAESLPERHTTVIVNSEPYYYYDGTYFRPAPSGYVVVPPPVVRQPVVVVPPPAPVVVAQPVPVMVPAVAPAVVAEPAMVSEITVNIPNARGSYTPVTLRRSGAGFVGAQGEFYPEFPKVEQLRLMYGQ